MIKDKRICVISHNDLDGITCCIILGNVYENIDFHNMNYNNIDDQIANINFSIYDEVYITDISPTMDKTFDFIPSEKLIMLDHHETARKYDNSNNLIVDVEIGSAAKLVYKYCIDRFDLDLGYLDELVELTHDYDTGTNDIPKSTDLNTLVYNLGTLHDFYNRFKSGDMQFRKRELDILETNRKRLEKCIKELNIFDLDSSGFKGCLILGRAFITEISKHLFDKGYELIIIYNTFNNSCYVRSMLEDLHLGKLLENVNGGGHQLAGGFTVTDKEDLQFKTTKIIECAEEELLVKC